MPSSFLLFIARCKWYDTLFLFKDRCCIGSVENRMHSMCHYCGCEATKKGDEKSMVGSRIALKPNGELESCRICREKLGGESVRRDGINSVFETISPTTSFSSSDRSISSCSDVSVDVNSCFRVQGNLDNKPNGQLYEIDRSSLMTSSSLKEGRNDSDGSSLRDGDSYNRFDNLSEEDKQRHIADDEMDSLVWDPPEAEDPEDDMEGSIALNDDDDCVDGTEWNGPSSLSSCQDEGIGSHRYKEDKKKVIDEVKNGKFKAAVSQLLKNEAVDTLGIDGEKWVDIVTSLSWEAALFLKPDTISGKAMDPDGYVKVKCIESGSRSESRVIKGLVFKKHAAHKHMTTKYKNPRLLLIRGTLGQSSNVLSSFKEMEQENDNLKSLLEMIEACRPNLVLVEKSVSRDVQECMLAKGITLVYDMKPHRLERVARCTGSPIFSSDSLTSQKLKQCDSFHFEKYVEEHARSDEGGKKPSKTLLFVEGCPTRLGCTILLKGSHSEVLKRIKSVIQHAVILAYHLILETSFIVDCKAMFSALLLAGVVDFSSQDQPSSHLGSASASGLPIIDVPISNETNEPSFSLFPEPYNPAVFSGFSSLSASLKKVLGYRFPLSTPPYQSLSNYFGLNETGTDEQAEVDVPVLKSVEDTDRVHIEAKNGSRVSDDARTIQHMSSFSESLPVGLKDVEAQENKVHNNDGAASILNSRSILVLMSSRNASRGTMCEQSHFSHIMFYRNFDVPLSKFLRDNLLNQKRLCTACGELPESHFYYYAHHDKQLTIGIKRLLETLPGESQGKIWMWSRCGKCKPENGSSRSSKRVLVSSLAGNLSFGKFLELSFSSHALSGMLPSCGHSLEKDFFYFFGRANGCSIQIYYPVTTYAVSLPPKKLDFDHHIGDHTLIRELEDVNMKGMLLFRGVEDVLKKLKTQLLGRTLNPRGSLKEFSEVEAMLKLDISEFERRLHSIVTSGSRVKASYELLTLNRLVWELLLQAYVWDQRLHSLLLLDSLLVGTGVSGDVMGKELKANINGTSYERNATNEALQLVSAEDKLLIGRDIPVDGPSQICGEDSQAEGSKSSMFQRSYNEQLVLEHDGSGCSGDGFQTKNMPQEETIIPNSDDAENSDSVLGLDTSREDSSRGSAVSSMEDSTGWFWMPFSEIQKKYRKDLRRGFSPRFQSIGQGHISAAHQIVMDEGSRIHVPIGTGNYIVRDYDDELSSMIACALAYLEDLANETELSEEAVRECITSAKSDESLHISARIPSLIAPHLLLGSSLESNSAHYNSSIAWEDSRLLESLDPSENLSPQVCLGVTKSLPKGKYSVICICAKQFRELRNRCCPSELDYIASLSRCKSWDAKGGKSKSFFAKTLDDRFIIKEIKKTEYESFVQFAPHYFKYMNESFDMGNQTCLAKVLGIYQVVIRQTRSGKEAKHDLMVMENLSFGRKLIRQYDLKGALHARFTSGGDSAGDVLLDQNFVNDMNSSPLYVSIKGKRWLARAVWNDTNFLNSINVMDYSLLVGVDTGRRELVCGIIDYLRQYTWDKQLETWVKSSLVVPKNVLPTIISPKEYKKRFRKFMSTHLLSVPDGWCTHITSSDPVVFPVPSRVLAYQSREACK